MTLNQKIIELKKDVFHQILLGYVLLQPFLDIVTGIMTKNMGNTFSIGVIIRTAFMIGIAIYAIILSKGKNRKRLIIYDSCVLVYIMLFMVISFLKFGFSSVFIQTKGIIKIFYLPVVLVALYCIQKEKPFRVDSSFFVYILFVYTFTIFIGKVTGTGFRSYNTIKESLGTVGFFYAANEIGAILCMLAPILMNDLIKNKGSMIFNMVSFILLLFSVFEIGTKVPFIGVTGLLIGCILVNLILFFHKLGKKHLYKAIYTVLLLVICFFITGYTPLGNNLNMDYGRVFPKIFQKGTVASKPGKLESMDKIQEALISKRDVVMEINQKMFVEGGWTTKLLGIGYINNTQGTVEETKLVEMDYYDILFNHGILGSILVFLPLISLLYMAVKGILLHLKTMIINTDVIFYTYAVFIALLIAMLAGHVLTAPAASFIFSVVLLELYCMINEIQTKEVMER